MCSPFCAEPKHNKIIDRLQFPFFEKFPYFPCQSPMLLYDFAKRPKANKIIKCRADNIEELQLNEHIPSHAEYFSILSKWGNVAVCFYRHKILLSNGFSSLLCIQIFLLFSPPRHWQKRNRQFFTRNRSMYVYDLNSNFVYFELFFNKTIPSGCRFEEMKKILHYSKEKRRRWRRS